MTTQQQPSAERIAELERKLAAQQKINKVLMERVERSVDGSGDAYSLFERNIILQSSVEERTRQLEQQNPRRVSVPIPRLNLHRPVAGFHAMLGDPGQPHHSQPR